MRRFIKNNVDQILITKIEFQKNFMFNKIEVHLNIRIIKWKRVTFSEIKNGVSHVNDVINICKIVLSINFMSKLCQ